MIDGRFPGRGTASGETTVTVSQPIAVTYIAPETDTSQFVTHHLRQADSIDFHGRVSTDALLEQTTPIGERTDCVLVSHRPPEIDAVESITAIRAVDRHLPVLVLAVNGSEHVASRVLAVGADGYVPIRPESAETPLDSLFEQLHGTVRDHQSRSGLELYRSLTEDAVAAAEVGIVIRDASGTVVWLNRSVERYLHVQGSHVIDRSFTEVVHEEFDDVLRAPEAFARVIREGPPIDDYDCRVLPSADRAARTLEYHERNIESGTFADGRVGLFYDVTDRRERKRQLKRQNERLDSFASVVSHDLREPLRTVQNYLDLLERRHGDDLDADAREFIDFAVDGTDRMRTLIDDVLTLARKGKVVGDPDTVDVERVAGAAWASITSEGATLTIEGEPGTIEADESRLQGIFENLLSNAVEHAGPDPHVRIGATATGFFVADDGPGIPPESRARVFEYRHTTDPESTGLGLTIASEIVDAHGWSLTITESQSGGARFDVDIDPE